MRVVWMGLVVLSAACAPGEDAFPETAAKAQCRRLAKCDASAYENRYDGDFKDCVSENQEAIEDFLGFVELFSSCEYQQAEAGEYLRTVASAECGSGGNGEISDELEDVYDCGGSSTDD